MRSPKRTAGEDRGGEDVQQHRSCFLASIVNPKGERKCHQTRPASPQAEQVKAAAFLKASPLRSPEPQSLVSTLFIQMTKTPALGLQSPVHQNPMPHDCRALPSKALDPRTTALYFIEVP